MRQSWRLFFFNDTATTEIYTLSLHDALPIFQRRRSLRGAGTDHGRGGGRCLSSQSPPARPPVVSLVSERQGARLAGGAGSPLRRAGRGAATDHEPAISDPGGRPPHPPGPLLLRAG